MKVTVEVEDYSNPAQRNIRVHNLGEMARKWNWKLTVKGIRLMQKN